MAKWKQSRLIIFFMLFLTACGGGGGNGGGGSPPITPPATQPPPPSASAPETRLFFAGGSILAVDPKNPSVNPVVVDPAATSGEAGLLDGKWSAAEKKITDTYFRTIIYANSDNGKLFKVSALKADSLTPTQVSNETGAVTTCGAGSVPDFADHNNSMYLYLLPGGDSACSTGDDVLKMVRLGMGPSDSPITITKERISILWDPATGAWVGNLAVDGSDLVRCDQNFQNCGAPLISFTKTLREFENDPLDGSVSLRVDGNLYRYDDKDGSLKLLHPFAAPCCGGDAEQDATHTFFNDGNQILKVPNDGSSPVTPVVTASNFTSMEITSGRVIYRERISASEATIKSISKSGTSPATLIPSTTDLISISATEGNFVYYSNVSLMSTGVIQDDGTGEVITPNSIWAGGTMSSTLSAANDPKARLIRAEGCSSTSNCAGGTLKSFDAAIHSGEVTLGTIPSDIVTINFLAAFGNDVLGEGVDGAGNSDIFFANVTTENSLQRLTDTPAKSERLFLDAE